MMSRASATPQPNLPESGQSAPMLGVDLVHAPQLFHAIDHVPLDPFRRRVGDRIARLHGVGEEHLPRRHAERHQEVELGGRGDLEAGAFLDEHLEHAPVRVRLDRVVRTHARHGRSEAPDLAPHDGGIQDQERPSVLLACCLAHDLEVEADFGVRVEKGLWLLLGYCGGLSRARDATAVPHQSLSS
jgi:hypothetical protein